MLSGAVEADETFLGGKGRDTNKRGRSETKQCVLVLAERHAGGKCILRHVPDAKAKTLVPIINRGVEKCSDIYTDGHKAYGSLGKLGYKHTEHVIKGSGIRAHIVLPAVHQVAKTLKAQLQGTHKRAPKDELLQDYLGAFQWRSNHRELEPVDAFLSALDVVLGIDHE
jgi:transposase-like protein